jgi:hypothetical protein
VGGKLAGTVASLSAEEVVAKAKELWDDPLKEQQEKLEALNQLAQNNVQQVAALLKV